MMLLLMKCQNILICFKNKIMFRELLSVIITPTCDVHKIKMKVYKHYTCETYWDCPKCRDFRRNKKDKNGARN